MAATADELGGLTPDEWEHLQDLTSALETAWKQGGPVDLRPYLPSRDAPRHDLILSELIKTDLECRWRCGRAVQIEFYLEQFPEDLGGSDTLPASLIHWEYHVRRQCGDRPPLEDYRARFPRQFDDVYRLTREESLRPTRRELDPTSLSAPPTRRPTEEAVPTKESSVFHTNRELRQIGGYTLIKRIGAGNFAEVWKVMAPGEILKAIKIISRPIDQEEAQQERKSLELIKNELRHHFLMPVHSFWISDERLVVVMDLADETLRDCLKKASQSGNGTIPLADLLRFTRESAEALDYLHDKGVQHRDIKPENILLIDGHVRVADFGLAKRQSAALGTGTMAGTPAYMAPETWQEKSHIHSDQYSLAATYYELRTGSRVFPTKSMPEMMNRHLYETPQLEPLAAAERDVLLKSMAKDPEDRYPSCVQFAEALERAMRPPTQAPPVSWVRRLGTLAAVVALGIGAWIAYSNWPTRPRAPDRLPPPSTAGKFRARSGSELVTVGNRRYFKYIDCDVGAHQVGFVFIHWDAPVSRSFYIMENKVWNGLFAQFAAAGQGNVAWPRWRLGARKDLAKDWNQKRPAGNGRWSILGQPRLVLLSTLSPNVMARCCGTAAHLLVDPISLPHPWDVGVDDVDLPVLRVEIEDAHRFAQWLAGKRGLLPSAEQWDKAAGKDLADAEAQVEPGSEGWQPGDFAVGRKLDGPMKVGVAKKDRSVHGCKDMAGNGLEWTRTLVGIANAEPVYFVGDVRKIRRGDDIVSLVRGHEFTQDQPLQLNQIGKQGGIRMPFFDDERPDHLRDSLPQIGFRVVIEVDF